MNWFGWLTRGHYEVTVLDKITFFVELAVVICVGIIAWLFIETVADKIKKFKNR